MNQPDTLTKLIEELAKIPGIGPRTAERMAFYMLNAPKADVAALSQAIVNAKNSVKFCSVCCNLSDTEPCGICADSARAQGTICIVEQPNDLWSIEKTGIYKGTYHVLYGHISPLEGVGPENLTIAKLLQRVKNGGPKEIIIATNPTLEGDGTALYLKQACHGYDVTISRIARGVPSGSTLSYATKSTLSEAIMGRQDF